MDDDEEVLGSLLSDLQDSEFPALAYDPVDIEAMIGVQTDLEDPGAGEPPEEPTAKRGDLWQCGEHRVLCGDCLGDEGRALAEECALVLTDPPYGMDLDTDYTQMRTANTTMKPQKYAPVVGDDSPFDFSAFAWLSCKEQLWWGADYYCQQLPAGGSWFVWDKRIPATDAMFGSCFELCWSRAPHKRKILRHNWAGITAHDPNERRKHPTQKPIAVFSELIEEYSAAGDIIYDPFLGSGTTMIAAEKLGRRCYGIEIEPRYVDVSVRRYEEMTGQKAELINEGDTQSKAGT